MLQRPGGWERLRAADGHLVLPCFLFSQGVLTQSPAAAPTIKGPSMGNGGPKHGRTMLCHFDWLFWQASDGLMKGKGRPVKKYPCWCLLELMGLDTIGRERHGLVITGRKSDT